MWFKKKQVKLLLDKIKSKTGTKKKMFKKLLEDHESHITEPVMADFESFSDNRVVYNKFATNLEDDDPINLNRNLTNFQKYGTFDKKTIESELYKQKERDRDGVIQKSAKLEKFQNSFGDDGNMYTDNLYNDIPSNIDSFKNFESFQTKGDMFVNEFGMKFPERMQKLKDKKNYDSVKFNEEFGFDSTRLIQHKKKHHQKISKEDMNKKNPRIRYSVNPNELDLNITSLKKKRLEDQKRTFESNFKKNLKKEKMGLNHTLGNKNELSDVDQRESKNFLFDSFTQRDDMKKELASNFSSFSQNKSVEKQKETFSMNLLQSFGNKPNEILIDLLSNWGSSFQLSLGEIKIFDSDYEEIKIKRDFLKLYNCNKICLKASLSRLFNNKVASKHTTDNLLLDYSQRKDKYSLKLELPLDTDIAFLVIWNCNEDPTKGVKKCRISFGGQNIFEGKLEKANGKKSNCYNHTIIQLNGNCLVQLMKEKLGSLITSMGYPRRSSRRRKPSDIEDRLLLPGKIKDKEKTPSKRLSGLSKMLDKATTPNPQRKGKNGERSDYPEPYPEDDTRNMGGISIFSNRNTRQTVGNEQKLHRSKIDEPGFGRVRQDKRPSNILIDHLEAYNNLIVPISPMVNGLTCKLISSWEDKSIIALNGIEVFNMEGVKVNIKVENLKVVNNKGKLLLNTEINKKLINDDYDNCDAKKQWVLNANRKLPVTIKIKFSKPQYISFIRIWNYNDSRIQAGKGVRNMIIANYEDNKLLFAGTIRKASGMLMKVKKNFEAIFFTKSKEVLQKISKSDWLFNKFSRHNKAVKKTINDKFMSFINDRPTTAELMEIKMNKLKSNKMKIADNIFSDSSQRQISLKYSPSNSVLGFKGNVTFKSLKIVVLETWDDLKEFCISGLEFFKDGKMKIPDDCFKALTKNKVIHSENISFDKSLKAKKPVVLRLKSNDENSIEIQFKQSYDISFMRIYSIFENKGFIKKGIKRVHLYGDNVLMNNDKGLYIKKASDLDFMKKFPQQINFPISQLVYNIEPKPSAKMPVSSPSGFTIQINLKSSFGDPYYIGLNGLEIFDLMGNNLLCKENEGSFRLIADPPGVFVLPNLSRDKRKAKNLFNGNNLSEDYSDIWLAPFVKYDSKYNKNILVIEFLNPITLGAINFWHYTKDPGRSVKEVEVLIDGNVIYCNALNDVKERILSSIIFNEVFMNKRMDYVKLEPIESYPVEVTELNNEGDILNKKREDEFLDSFRPTTGLHH